MRLAHTILALAFAGLGSQTLAASYSASSPINLNQSYTFLQGSVASGASSFSDSFSFSLASGVNALNFLFNMGLPSAPTNSFNFTLPAPATPSALSGGPVTVNYSYQDEDGETISYSLLSNIEYRFGATNVLPGNMTVNINGHFQSPLAATSGYAFTVSAVPEPGTLALFLAGLGLLAGIAHRKTLSAY